MEESHSCHRIVCFYDGVRLLVGDKWKNNEGKSCSCLHVRVCLIDDYSFINISLTAGWKYGLFIRNLFTHVHVLLIQDHFLQHSIES